MKVTDWMDSSGVCVGVTLREREGVVDLLAALQQKSGNTDNCRQLRRDIYYREEETSAAIGAGTAIFSVESKAVRRPLITAVTLTEGVDLDAPDGEKSRLIFLAAVPPGTGGDCAARLTVLLMNENLRDQLMEAADESTFFRLLEMAEEGSYTAGRDAGGEMPVILLLLTGAEEEEGKAAAQLQLAAGRLGFLLKTERPGGPAFSGEDLRSAAGILMLGDGAPSARFDGKPVRNITSSDGIYRPEHLLRTAAEAPVFYKKTTNRPARRGLSGWFLQTRVLLLPALTLAGGCFQLIGEGVALFSSSASAVFSAVGAGAFSLILPLISGLIAFRFARWPGLAAGLTCGVILGQTCGGVWAALAGGILAGAVMRRGECGLRHLPRFRRAAEWILAVLGVGLMGSLALAAGACASRLRGAAAQFFQQLQSPLNRGFLAATASGLDPAGPLQQGFSGQGTDAVANAAITAAVLAVALGVIIRLVFLREPQASEQMRTGGWTALPAALSGSMEGWLFFYAGDPFKTAVSAALGAGTAGLISAACGFEADRQGIFSLFFGTRSWALLLAVLGGGAMTALLLIFFEKMNRSVHMK